MEKLTERELEVLALLTCGYMNKDIARILFIAERTVKAHLTSIFRKMNVKNRTAAVTMAISSSRVND